MSTSTTELHIGHMNSMDTVQRHLVRYTRINIRSTRSETHYTYTRNIPVLVISPRGRHLPSPRGLRKTWRYDLISEKPVLCERTAL